MAGKAVPARGYTPLTGRGPVWFGEPKSRWRTTAWVLFTLIICVHFALTYSLEMDFLDLKAYMLGGEKTPYQYRVLMMYVFRLLATKHVVIALAEHTQHMHVPAGWQKPQKLVEIGVAMVSLFGAVLSTVGTLTKLTGDRIFSRWMSLLLIYMAYADLAPAWGLAYSFPYDTPSLMRFCLGVYLVVCGRDW